MFKLQVSRVGHGQSSEHQPLFDDVVKQIEGLSGHALIRGIINDERAAFIRRNDLSRKEVLGCPRGLAAPGWPAEHDECVSRDRNFVQRGDCYYGVLNGLIRESPSMLEYPSKSSEYKQVTPPPRQA